MKKIISIFIICFLSFCLSACSNSESTEKTQNINTSSETSSSIQKTEKTESQSEISNETSSENSVSEESVNNEIEENENSTLVVYFSATGNTKSVAETLAELQNADIYEIVPKQPYSDKDLNYNDKSSRSTVEQNNKNSRPAISNDIDNIYNYDVIYVGYPIWWGDMPHILYTFFDTYDLSGKTIAPFCTSGGSGLSRTPQTIAELEPDASITNGLHIGSSSLSDAERYIAEWVSSIGL